MINMIRRRKSSCPDIEHRRSSLANSSNGRNGVKLDLYIDDDELYTNGTVTGGTRHRTPSPTNLSHHSSPDCKTANTNANIEDLAEEVLCLRLLSTRTRYRFGGLQIQLVSPVFHVGKLFTVEFDQDSQVSLIKSQQSNLDQQSASKSSSQGSLDPKLNGAKSATIKISPDMEDFDPLKGNGNLSALSTDLTLFEESTKSPKKPLHVSAHSLLTKTPEAEPRRLVQHPPLQAAASTASDHSGNSVKFDNVKVYANLDRSSLITKYDLETKNLIPLKSGKSKASNLRRHTHYYCYIPNSVSQTANKTSGTRSTENLADGRRGSGSHTIRRFMAKKVTDTWHSAVRAKRNLLDSFSYFK